MSDLTLDLMAASGQIKHFPENVDLYDLRTLLNRAKYQLEALAALQHPKELHFRDGEVTIVVECEDPSDIVLWLMGGEGEQS